MNTHLFKKDKKGRNDIIFIAILLAAVISVGASVFVPHAVSLEIFKAPAFYVSLGIFLLTAFCVFFVKKIHPILLICIAALLGIGAGYLFEIPLTSI
jgi:chromate transporter